MKKLLLATAVMFCVGGAVLRAEKVLTPTGELTSLATADYGGVFASTYSINFLVSGAGIGYGTASLANTSGVFYGALFSSGTGLDFVDVWDSTSADNTKITSTPNFRMYNVNAATGGAGGFAAGLSGTGRPIRFTRGLIYRPSRADFNSLNIIYYIHP